MSNVRVIPVNERISRALIPNDGIMDEPTNAYIVGRGPVVIVDPGSVPGYSTLRDVLDRIGSPDVAAILLTHAHPDHAGGAKALHEATGASVWLHPKESAEAAYREIDLPAYRSFVEGQLIEIEDLAFEVVDTPGHAVGHVALVERQSRLTFAGDLVAGTGTVAVTPPFGDMRAYLDSLEKLRGRGIGRLLPGHGNPLDDGPQALGRILERRLTRESEILALVKEGPTSVDQIVDQLYPALPAQLRRAAAGTVTAHLDKLIAEQRVRQQEDGVTQRYRAVAEF